MFFLKTLIQKGIVSALTNLNYLHDLFTFTNKEDYKDRNFIVKEKIEELMTFNELAESKGYIVENHKIETEDGYILMLHHLSLSKEKEHILIEQNKVILKNHKINQTKTNSNIEKEIEILNDYKNIFYNTQNKHQAIFLMHGIFDSSEGWILNDEDKCIPFILVNMGYDVWLGNSRGNKFSRDHRFLMQQEDNVKEKISYEIFKKKTQNSCTIPIENNINHSFFNNTQNNHYHNKKFNNINYSFFNHNHSKNENDTSNLKHSDPYNNKNKKLKDEYWDFSFYEMGKYDLPAFIEFILKKNTQTNKLIYIGHSQGTIQLFSGLATDLDYFKSKIKLFIALGPIVKTKNIESPLYDFFDLIKLDFIAMKIFGVTELLPFSPEAQYFFSFFSKYFKFLPNMIAEIVGDKNSGMITNYNRLNLFFTHGPSGSSAKALCHLVQMFRSDTFCLYDYGKEENKKKYGTDCPPELNLDHVKDFPIALFSGQNDRLSHPKDVEWLEAKIKDTIIYKNSFEHMGHISFHMANNIDWFSEGFRLINKYSRKNY